MIVIGLTGGIGMGKSTVAQMFAQHGVAVWDADAVVHKLYAPGGKAVPQVLALFPGVVLPDGAIDRAALGTKVLGDPDALRRLESVIHPLVAADRSSFLEVQRDSGAWAALCDIPLLFETGADKQMDITVTVSAPAMVQKARVMARPGMTGDRLQKVLSQQWSDKQRRDAADHVIDTGGTLDDTKAAVAALVARLRS